MIMDGVWGGVSGVNKNKGRDIICSLKGTTTKYDYDHIIPFGLCS